MLCYGQNQPTAHSTVPIRGACGASAKINLRKSSDVKRSKDTIDSTKAGETPEQVQGGNERCQGSRDNISGERHRRKEEMSRRKKKDIIVRVFRARLEE